MLTSTTATRQISPPATTPGPGRSPCATATQSGSSVEASADTGATTLIGATEKPK